MKKINQRIAARSRAARINRQPIKGDERDELEDVVCGVVRPTHEVPRFATIQVVETRLGHRTSVHEIELAS